MASCHQSHLMQSIFIATGTIFLMNVSVFLKISSSSLPGMGAASSCRPCLPPLPASLPLFSTHTSLSAIAYSLVSHPVHPLLKGLTLLFSSAPWAQPLSSSSHFTKCHSTAALISSWSPHRLLKHPEVPFPLFLSVPHRLPQLWFSLSTVILLGKFLS